MAFDKVAGRLNLIIVGDSAVGKTCLMTRFMVNSFHENTKNTVAVDFMRKTVKFDGQDVTVQVFDTVGQGVLVVYDVTSEKSFDSTGLWLRHVRQYAPENIPAALIANKTDCVRVVSEQDGRDRAGQVNAFYYEMSAKTGEGAEAGFMEFVPHVWDYAVALRSKAEAGEAPKPAPGKAEERGEQPSGGCC